MPFIKLSTNLPVADDTKALIVKSLGKSISLLPGKSETWLMVDVQGGRSLFFQGSDSPCLMAEVKLYGRSDKRNYQALAEAITSLAQESLEIPSSRVYVEFEETPYWAFDGNLF